MRACAAKRGGLTRVYDNARLLVGLWRSDAARGHDEYLCASRADKIHSVSLVAEVLCSPSLLSHSIRVQPSVQASHPPREASETYSQLYCVAAAKMSSDKPLPFIYQFAAGA